MKTDTEYLLQDPFELGQLPLLDPEQDGWPEIRQALEEHARARRHRKRAGGWLAAAAGVILALGVVIQQTRSTPQIPPDLAQSPPATDAGQSASFESRDTVHELIAMSQTLEQRLRGLRAESGALPAQSAIYIAELEDMIVRVDGELSLNPKSVDLWGQRVNLLLDLELIFQHHWEREYGRMAAR